MAARVSLSRFGRRLRSLLEGLGIPESRGRLRRRRPGDSVVDPRGLERTRGDRARRPRLQARSAVVQHRHRSRLLHQSYRDAEAFAKETKAPWVFHFLPSRGHEYFFELDKPAFELLLKQKRTRYSREYSTLFFGYSDGAANDFYKSQQWLRATKFDANLSTPCKVAVKDNVATIDAPRLEAGSLLLNDELVKLDEPVVVMLDGKEVFRGVVERDVKFLLDGYDALPDRRRLFWNVLDFKR